MYEKYDISNGGQPGGGGEYEVQEGFGWTNGVVLMLLDRYGDRLSSGTQTVFLECFFLPLSPPSHGEKLELRESWLPAGGSTAAQRGFPVQLMC